MSLSKKISRLMLAMLLLVSTNGFTLSKHYCMGILKSVSVEISGHEDAGEDCGGMEMLMDCCDDEHTQFKVNDLSNDFSSIDFQFVLPTPDFYLPIQELFADDELAVINYPDFSPPDYQEDIYMVNQVFRL